MSEVRLSEELAALHNRVDLVNIPFTDRGSRLLVFVRGAEMSVRLAERWVKWENEYGHYRQRIPIIERFQFFDTDGAPLALTPDTYPHVARLQTAQGAFALGAEEFTVENGLLTPTQKPRRRDVLARYGTTLEALYEEPPLTSARAAPAASSPP